MIVHHLIYQKQLKIIKKKLDKNLSNLDSNTDPSGVDISSNTSSTTSDNNRVKTNSVEDIINNYNQQFWPNTIIRYIFNTILITNIVIPVILNVIFITEDLINFSKEFVKKLTQGAKELVKNPGELVKNTGELVKNTGQNGGDNGSNSNIVITIILKLYNNVLNEIDRKSILSISIMQIFFPYILKLIARNELAMVDISSFVLLVIIMVCKYIFSYLLTNRGEASTSESDKDAEKNFKPNDKIVIGLLLVSFIASLINGVIIWWNSIGWFNISNLKVLIFWISFFLLIFFGVCFMDPTTGVYAAFNTADSFNAPNMQRLTIILLIIGFAFMYFKNYIEMSFSKISVYLLILFIYILILLFYNILPLLSYLDKDSFNEFMKGISEITDQDDDPAEKNINNYYELLQSEKSISEKKAQGSINTEKTDKTHKNLDK